MQISEGPNFSSYFESNQKSSLQDSLYNFLITVIEACGNSVTLSFEFLQLTHVGYFFLSWWYPKEMTTRQLK